MTVVVPTVADVLRGIAGEVRRDPSIWMQGALGRAEDGRPIHHPDEMGAACAACAVGLVCLAFGSTDDFVIAESERAAEEALSRTLHDDGLGRDSLADWNDDQGRTAEEVAARFERAAELLDRGVVA